MSSASGKVLLQGCWLWGVAVLLLTACSASQPHGTSPASKTSSALVATEKDASGSSLLLADHPLAGRIWNVSAGKFISQDQLAEGILESDYLLLGETHDNPRHHQGQAWVISRLGARQGSGAVAFEMISLQQGKMITEKQYDSVQALIDALNHINPRWDYDQQYRPVFDAALKAGYALLPASFDRQEIMAIAGKGESALPSEVKTLMAANPFSDEQIAGSRKEIEGSHCGMINEKMTNTMMLVQRAKDAGMALAIDKRPGIKKWVLIAGSGHVRKDRGVPFFLRGHNGKLTAIAWVEVQEGENEPDIYAGHWGADSLPFDFVWFTPRADRPDPCEQFRRHMKNKQ